MRLRGACGASIVYLLMVLWVNPKINNEFGFFLACSERKKRTYEHSVCLVGFLLSVCLCFLFGLVSSLRAPGVVAGN